MKSIIFNGLHGSTVLYAFTNISKRDILPFNYDLLVPGIKCTFRDGTK
jgi:hypothetical protein